MSEKIQTCKPCLIRNRADFNYNVDIDDKEGTTWQFVLHTLSAKQRGIIQASFMKIKIDESGEAKTEIEANDNIIKTTTILQSLDSWNLDEPITAENIDLMPSDVYNSLYDAIIAHQTQLNKSMPGQAKNS